MKILRLLGLRQKESQLQKKLEQQNNLNLNTDDTKLDISVNKILQFSAKTAKKK